MANNGAPEPKVDSLSTEPPNTPIAHEDPLAAYEQSRDSLVYRLSEAMFASLLASYIIGFTGRTNEIWSGVEAPTWKAISETCSVLFVSLTFAFLTTAIYVKYNMAILTLHTYSLRFASRDFFMAVSQGILFGFSMVWPIILPLSAATVFAAGIVILWHETGLLATFLQNTKLQKDFVSWIETDDPQRAPNRRRTVRKRIRTLIGDCYSEWKLPSPLLHAGVAVLLAIGVALPIASYFLFPKEATLHCTMGANFIVLILILLHSYRISSDGGDFLRKLRRGDQAVKKQYWNLKDNVAKLGTEDFRGLD